MSTETTKTRDERIDIRVNSEAKSLFMRAAELSGQNLSAFVIEAVRERAMKLLDEHERLVLNNSARDNFLNALDTPPPPNTPLRRAADKYAVK